ncbi:EAL domain-containing protein [Oxalobacteraceae bacterium OM1]|nr:EAL domain-containing protein [Oxalobacteraceae bacterium OM1]
MVEGRGRKHDDAGAEDAAGRAPVALSQACDALSIGMAIVNARGMCDYANATLLRLLDVSLEEIQSMPLHDLVHVDGSEQSATCNSGHCRLHEALSGAASGTREFDTVFCRRNQPPFYAACRISPLQPGGAGTTLLEVRDVTALRQQELVQRTHELVYTAAARAARFGSWRRDLHHNTVLICAVMARILELPGEPTTLDEAQWRDLILADDLVNVEMQLGQALAVGDDFELEYRVRLPSGRVAWLWSHGTVQRDADGKPASVVGMSVDITRRKRIEDALKASEERYRQLTELSPAGIVVIAGNRYVYANEVGARLLGAGDVASLVGQSPFDVVDPRLHDLLNWRADEVLQHGRTPEVEFELRRRDGSSVWVHSIAGKVSWEGVPAVQVINRDITEERRTREQLRILTERINLALESAGEAVWDWDIASDVYTVSGGLKNLFGWANVPNGDGLVDWRRHAHPDDWARMRKCLDDYLRGLVPTYQCEYRLRADDGSWRWVLVRGVIVARDADSKPLAMTGTISDITVRKESEELAWRHANLDPLTGLPNRRLCRERLEQELRRARRSNQQLALLFIDLDRFKQVNDWLGHEAGDQLLIEAAQRIARCVRDTDTVARLGGDEFTVLLVGLDGPRHVEFVCQKILEQLTSPFRINGELAYISASIGVALYPGDASLAPDLLRKADQAMYAAKASGKQQFRYFTRELDDMAHRRLQITSELRRALSNGELDVHYQPVVRLSDGRIVKAEALARWRHPDLGDIAPAVFIPLAEEAGLIGQIGDWVLDRAIHHSQAWRDHDGSAIQVGINQSPLQFAMLDAATDKLHALVQAGHAGHHIAIEITEGTLLDASPHVRQKLLFYRDAGIQVAIDDFGTGYSSMAYLQRFHIDYLKIDRSFVRDIASNPADRTIAETIIVMAHKLGLEVIAEGIETTEQRDCLAHAGCDYGQGFLFSPAVPAAAFEGLLSGGNGASKRA